MSALQRASSPIRVTGGGMSFGDPMGSIREGGCIGESACGSSSELEGSAHCQVLQGRKGN